MRRARACAAAVAFVKKERKGNFRKKERVKSDEEEADAANIRKQIEDTKLEHKLRGRVVGVEANKLMVNSGLKEHKVVAEDNEAEASMLDTQVSDRTVAESGFPDAFSRLLRAGCGRASDEGKVHSFRRRPMSTRHTLG